jgi:RimJ/RimL family protein N-acetyltransferase
MVQRTPGSTTLIAVALTRVPDLPRWIDTRGMLLSGRSVVHVPPDNADGHMIAAVPDAALASVVGRPPVNALLEVVSSLAGDVNVLSQLEDADHIASALAGWRRQRAIIHVLPPRLPWEPDTDRGARIFSRETAPRFDHVPESLRRELLDALNGRTVSRFVPGHLPSSTPVVSRVTVPMAAVWADGRPVSFCYPVWQTETLWDVSIETLPAYRRQGLGARAARTLIRHMRARGRAPVWGALEANSASRALAARLGFLETAGIAVFTAASSAATPRTSPGRTPPHARG